MEKIAIYPGSFDPVTNGHLDIIERGLKIFDRIIITILENPAKSLLFTIQERKDLLAESLEDFSNIEIASYDGLLVDYAKQRGAHAILR
ncbi:MAG: pantetheine-phosphate adenylyltransferase, partial [Desulfosalsimonas sp.]